jgi:hypothetical protein
MSALLKQDVSLSLVTHFSVALTRDEAFGVDVLTIHIPGKGSRQIRGECASFLRLYFETQVTDRHILDSLPAIQSSASSLRWLRHANPDVFDHAQALNKPV